MEIVNDEVFYCEYCKRNFSNEKSLIVHSCEKKTRWLWRDEKYVRLGLIAYQKFYTICYNSLTPKTHTEFINSRYYTDFVKFGKHLLNINAIDPEGFIEFLIRSDVKMHDWSSDFSYDLWIRELSKKENPDKALERNILLMEEWARDTGENWFDFFRKINTVLATKWIKTGRISPWLLYSGFAGSLFDRMSDEQLMMIKEYIDPIYWNNKIKKYKEDIDFIKNILKESGL